jgi:hypothetical protein
MVLKAGDRPFKLAHKKTSVENNTAEGIKLI